MGKRIGQAEITSIYMAAAPQPWHWTALNHFESHAQRFR